MRKIALSELSLALALPTLAADSTPYAKGGCLARGGIAIVYRCPDGCAEILGNVQRAIMEAVDPDCQNTKRVLLTPDKDLDVKIAASAWGYTWKSDCLDAATRPALVKFINDHIGSKGEAPMKDAKICQ